MDITLKNLQGYILNKIGRIYCRKVCRHEYYSQKYLPNERPIEYGYLFKWLCYIYPERILDVGTGITSLPHIMRCCGFIVSAIDNINDYWEENAFNRHYHIQRKEISNFKPTDKYDFVCCISVLEHIIDYERAVKSMISLLNPNGYLLLSFPYNEGQYVENIYKHKKASYGKDASYICRVYSRYQIKKWEIDFELEMVDQEYWKVFSGEFWTFGERLRVPEKTCSEKDHQLTCILFKKPIL